MEEVSVRELRNYGGQILDRVEGGESMTITRDGTPVALLSPLPTPRLSAAALLERTLAIQRKLYGPGHPVVGRSLYNLACVRSRQGNAEAALGHLREAMDAGWASPLILDDPDLDGLRGDPRFETILAEVKARL
jgi:prevent-host-death family protein